MFIFVKIMFIERKKKSRFPWFTQTETSRPCAEWISTASMLTKLTAFFFLFFLNRRIQTINTL